ncbi:phage tail protein [Neisseria musculi]|uniref:Phage tail family protein n=1 Tax=Neisseria musculi TaxID=1815583 RepID=A0A7H1M9T4_9NEIS|nr:phage tail protein [Neisseria musculi]QNT58399.1 phage tail family protein [Neisseria musculi]
MGGKTGGGQSTPYEAPNTLSSAQSLRIIDAISEGVVAGFANGNDAPFKSVFFDDTAVQNPDGSFNYKGVVGFFQRGMQDQAYVPGFDASERTVPVSAGVKNAVPIVRSVTDGLVGRLRVTVAVERNAAVNDKGDTLPANTSVLVELVGNQGVQASQMVTFTEKGSGMYYQDVQFDKLPAAPFNIRVSRVTPDSTTDKVSNNTYFSSYVEIIDAKLSYPHTAFAALAIDSDQFGNSVPRRNYLLKGRLVKVPANYDPETRTYSGQTWDGSFKQAWTNNPAWVFYDVLTQPRFSTLARRLKVADVDKWSLYQIAKYCDELVDDGFGGKEPRFVCNAYITNLTQAGEFLLNLASVFTGLPVWNGAQMSVVMDANVDPVAMYNNSNVKDGLFTYSGAAYKSIHTAVHVQYVDKYDGYRTKTEYVADNEAIARYGLNIKQITAFGCDSRGQAARFGAWTLQTELRQQNMVSFEIGREGLKHLPYDIVQVMDNQYAGAELSGRVAAVEGTTVTLDREVSDVVGSLFFYSNPAGLQSAKVLSQPAANQVVLEAVSALEAAAGWALSGKVKPRLYRAIGIKENADAGTYTVTGLLHDPKKYAAVDTWANFDREITTLHNITPVLVNGNVAADGGVVVISWDNLSAGGQVLTYDIKIYRNNQLYRHIPDAQSAEVRLENLPNGNYKAEIRGRNARGALSEPLVKAWSIDYTVTGLRTTPKTLAISIDWVLPQTVVSELVSELWYARSADFQTATKLASLPYPQNSYQLTGVGVVDTYYFWVRIVDAAGNSGEFTAAVMGQADKDPAPIVQQIQGAITKSALSQSLIESLNSDMAGAAAAAGGKAQAAAAVDASNKIMAEAAARQKALQAEAAARTAAVRAAADKAAKDLAAKAAEIGTRVAAVENVNATQAQQINTVTAAQSQTAAALEAERTARVKGDEAEAKERRALVTRVAAVEGSITKETQARTAADNALSAETNALKTRIGNTESGITALRKTVADETQARSQQVDTLTAKFNNLNIGGRNLIRDSGVSRNHGYLRQYPLADAPKVGETVTVTVWGQLGETRNGQIGVYNTHGYRELFKLEKVSDGLWRGTGVWNHHTNPNADKDQDVYLNLYAYPRTGENNDNRFDRVKLERGSVATDWTPAPEDDNAAAAEVSAQLNAYKEAQAQKDKAQTDEIHAAKAKIGQNEAQIHDLKSTKADKTQVVAQVRSELQAEWRGYADRLNTVEYVNNHVNLDERTPGWYAAKPKGDSKMLADAGRLGIGNHGFVTVTTTNAYGQPAHVTQRAVSSNSGSVWQRVGNTADVWGEWKMQETAAGAAEKAEAAKAAAVQTASADAQAKADAAKAAAERAAQTKADAAKAAAIAAASGDAKAKADAAKAAAIADAAAKDAVIQSQAAADAKAKADAAKDAAIAEARRLNTATDAKITTLQQTVSEQGRAAASQLTALTAKVDNLNIGGRNLIRDSGVSRNHGYQRNYNLVEDAPKVGETVTVTVWGQLGETRNGEIGVYNTHGYRELFKLEKVSDGLYRGTGIWKHHTNANDKRQNVSLNLYAYPNNGTNNDNRFDRVKLEIGNVATDWTPAPEDVEASATAKVQVAQEAVAELSGKVQSMYTLKTEAVHGGRKVISGLALGADGKTGDSQMLVYADKFALVDPNSKTMKAPFVVVNEGGRAKVALDGDLIADGLIHGKHIAAGQTLQAPVLNSGTINAGSIIGGVIRGARIEAVDLEAANIIGDVVSVRGFSFTTSHHGYQELTCRISESRRSKRTVIIPQVLAVAEDGARVDLQLYFDGILTAHQIIQSPTKTTRHSSSHHYSTWTSSQSVLIDSGKGYRTVTIPSAHIHGQIPISFDLPYTVPKIGGIARTMQIDGAEHTLNILCRVNGNFNYEPLGDVSGIVCFIV